MRAAPVNKSRPAPRDRRIGIGIGIGIESTEISFGSEHTTDLWSTPRQESIPMPIPTPIGPQDIQA
jgi:hypothetical protein